MTASGRSVALTIGDPNGIGPEIAVKAAVALAGNTPRVVLVGDAFVIRHYAEREAKGFAVREVAITAEDSPQPQTIDVVPVESLPREAFAPGHVDGAAGRATVAYVEAALTSVRAGQACAIVGCPHNEMAVNAAGIAFTGYPGLVARLSGLAEERVFLMLIGEMCIRDRSTAIDTDSLNSTLALSMIGCATCGSGNCTPLPSRNILGIGRNHLPSNVT